MAGLFYKLGRLAGPKLRKGQWLWQSLAGSEEDVLKAEKGVGQDIHAAMCGELGIDSDQALARGIQSIGQSLALAVRDKNRHFRITVAQKGEPNAFALPGGFIFITRSLIELVDRERDAIAFVLGHEMGHVLKQHPMERIWNDATLSAALRMVPVAGGAAGQWIKSSTLRLMQSAYSQDNEYIADKIGAELCAAAGYGYEGGPRLLEQLLILQSQDAQYPLAEYFTSHPPLAKRIEALRERAG